MNHFLNTTKDLRPCPSQFKLKGWEHLAHTNIHWNFASNCTYLFIIRFFLSKGISKHEYFHFWNVNFSALTFIYKFVFFVKFSAKNQHWSYLKICKFVSKSLISFKLEKESTKCKFLCSLMIRVCNFFISLIFPYPNLE